MKATIPRIFAAGDGLLERFLPGPS